MKTTEEQIEVMKAFTEGKEIECFNHKGELIYTYIKPEQPAWDWLDCDYRVKEEPKYRPYEHTEEMIDDFCKRFGVTRTKFGEPFIWVRLKKNATNKHLISDFYEHSVDLTIDMTPLTVLFDKYTFLDGSPIGMKE